VIVGTLSRRCPEDTKEFHVDKIAARVTDQQDEFCGVSCAAETAEAAASVMRSLAATGDE
jgi:hypothetical protein